MKRERNSRLARVHQSLGVLGAGNIAAEVIKRAVAFGMPVVMWSRRFNGQNRALTPAEAQQMGLDHAGAHVMLAPTPGDVASRADVLSLHLALGPETKGMVNADILGRLKPGAMVINTARAEVVDAAALRAAIKDRQLRVGLDVFAEEPATPAGEFADPIASDPGVIGTHHIGASTDQAQEAIAAETVRIVKSFKDTGKAPNAVN